MHFVVTHKITVYHHEQELKTIFRTDELEKNLYKLVPTCQRKEKLMHKEGSFINNGKTNASLYLKVKKQYVFCVMRGCQLWKSIIYVGILTTNTELSMLILVYKKNEESLPILKLR